MVDADLGFKYREGHSRKERHLQKSDSKWQGYWKPRNLSQSESRVIALHRAELSKALAAVGSIKYLGILRNGHCMYFGEWEETSHRLITKHPTWES